MVLLVGAARLSLGPPQVTLTVHSAPGSYRGPDALDITRLGFSGKPDAHGSLFAPSWDILKPYKDAQREWEALEREAGDLGRVWEGAERFAYYAQADRMKRETWAWYKPAYMAEMRVCYGLVESKWGAAERAAAERGVVAHRTAWLAELKRERRVYQCFCPVDKTKPIEEQHCHRIVFRGIIAKVGAFHGVQVIDGGEL